MTREEAFEEYFRLAGFVQAYDGYFVGIKTWGVTVTGGSLAIGFTQHVTGAPLFQFLVFMMAFLLAVSFWCAEVYFKLLQLSHIPRLSNLEEQLASGATVVSGPAILSSFGHAQATNRAHGRWRHVLMFPHVLVPHAALAAVSGALVVISLVRLFASSGGA